MTEKTSYLGFDFSTQQLKAIVINDQFVVIHECTVTFDSVLPEFRTHGGVIASEDNLTVTAPTIMWVKALDMLLELLKLDGLDFSTVASLSGAAQQHGSVYWKNNAEEMLQDLSPTKFLHEQLQGCFSVRDSPVWMDSSTKQQCDTLEMKIGVIPLCYITGSRAFERFTGSQIAKIYETKQSAYDMTERISLVSSFGATLFLGKYAPIDFSDGSGMNLLNIHEKAWSDVCLEACAPSLKEKLGTPVPSCTVLGTISSYFVERYGFSENCKVVAFTGDNPASLAGIRMDRTDLGISLGTSDTLFLWLNKTVKTDSCGHIFVNPIDSGEFMGLLCFKNGSLTRERLRDECAEGSWQLFNDLLESTPRGNFGNMGFYFDLREIIPPTTGDFRFNRSNERVQCFSKEVEVRAVVEGQFIAKRVYAEDFGFEIKPSTRIIATGGASTNKAVIQVLSDVFNLPVYVLDNKNSACLGSAFRAKHGLLGEDYPFQSMFENSVGLSVFATPAADASEVYGPMLARYRRLHSRLTLL